MKLPWHVLLLIAASGVVMGGLSIAGLYGATTEAILWTVLLLVVWIPLLAWAKPERPIAAGLVAGGLAGLGTGGLQAVFIEAYLENHPGTGLVGGSNGSMAAFLLGTAILIGIAWGALGGVGAWGARKLMARRAPSPG